MNARRSSLPQNTLSRSSTLSKIKRFGSLLIKSNKKHQPQDVRPKIQTRESTNSSLTSHSSSLKTSTLSLSSTISATEEFEEEALTTPTSSTHNTSLVTLTDTFPTIKIDIPKQPQHITEPLTVPISSTSYPTVSLVRSHLQSAFDLVDQEIEETIERSRNLMHQSITKPPLYHF